MYEVCDCFYVPENSENLASVSKLTRGAKVVFCIEQRNGTVFPLSERSIFQLQLILAP